MSTFNRPERTHPWPTLFVTRNDITDAQIEDVAKLEREHFPNGFRQVNATTMMLFYYGKELVGKLEYYTENTAVHVEWFLAPEYGKVCWDEFVHTHPSMTSVSLVCVADPRESVETVLRRFTFYTKTIGGFSFQDVQYGASGETKFYLIKTY